MKGFNQDNKYERLVQEIVKLCLTSSIFYFGMEQE